MKIWKNVFAILAGTNSSRRISFRDTCRILTSKRYAICFDNSFFRGHSSAIYATSNSSEKSISIDIYNQFITKLEFMTAHIGKNFF